MIKKAAKVLSIMVFAGVLLIGKNASAEDKYYLGLLIQEESKEPTLLETDPMLKHEIMYDKYKKTHKIPENENVVVLWGGEIKKTDGKYAVFNETSSFAKEKHKETASIKNIEKYMHEKNPEDLAEGVKFLSFDESAPHLHESLEKLADLRHEIPNRIGVIFYCVETGPEVIARYDEVGKHLLAELPKAIDATLNNLNYIKEYSLTKHPSLEAAIGYLTELKVLVANNSSLVEFRDRKLKSMEAVFRELQHLDYIEISEVASTVSVQDSATKETSETKIPLVINRVLDTQQQELITEDQIINTLKVYTGRKDLNTVEELLDVLYGQIAPKLFLEQKDVNLFFQEGLYDYMENNIDKGDNRSMLLIIGAKMWSAGKGSFVYLGRDDLIKIYNTYAETESLVLSGVINDPYKAKVLDKPYGIPVPKEVYYLRNIGRSVFIKN